jgi:hypothetical protein
MDSLVPDRHAHFAVFFQKNSQAVARRMSAIGPKQTSLVAPHMSAFGG